MPRPSARLAIAGAIWLIAAPTTHADDPTGTPGQWRQHDMRRPVPPVVEPGEAPIATRPPKDALVLFDGSNLDAWHGPGGGPAAWKVSEGVLQVAPGGGMITTKQSFGDLQLHVEWSAPNPPAGKGQDRGNSGIFLMSQFEVQVIDSFQARTYADGQAGAIYGQYPPLVNPARPPGQWQYYDIAFRRPRYDASKKLLEKARITVFFNGLLVQDNEEPFGETSWLKWSETHGDRGPISLQDHSHPVRFRNIWLREIADRPRPIAEDLKHAPRITLPEAALDAFAGTYVQGNDANGSKLIIARDGDHLTVRFPFLPAKLAIVPISETEFDMPTTDATFQFRKDADGHVTGALFHIADGERDWRRVDP